MLRNPSDEELTQYSFNYLIYYKNEIEQLENWLIASVNYPFLAGLYDLVDKRHDNDNWDLDYLKSQGFDFQKTNFNPLAGIYPPLVSRQHERWRLSYLKKRGHDVTTIEQAVTPLDARFRAVRDAHKDEYLHHLLFNFHNYFERFHPDHITEDPYVFETRICYRDTMEAIRLELEQFIDIRNELEKLQKLDETIIRLIPESIKQRNYSPDDYIEAPPEIWWRHLEEKFGEPVD
ncbi:MAG: hypothetical protein CVV32_13000 [Methanomicrobiales archaeon HGW-Methanomicrobiales-3]|jgi:hypothetical protein|nr:MAG: hypothetical protein CVV32_13000 [Methanomicrobiales archaeon HGW-Methanomicrobiales-3]